VTGAAAIEVRDLEMRYGPVEAVRGVDLRVEAGEVFALLGPNGAGKTTTVEILEGYRHRSSGEVTVLGVDPQRGGAALRARVGIVLQECAVDPYLTVRESLTQRAAYYRAPRRVGEVVELVGLGPQADNRVKRLSGGQQRRLDLALALVGDPELLFLDEPTTGFDPGARRAAWEVVSGLAGLGMTVVLTTHYMDEAQALAGRVAVMVDGRIVAEGPPGALSAETVAYRISFRIPAEPSIALPPIDGLEVRAGEAVVRTDRPTEALHRLTGWAIDAGTELQDLSVGRPSLEDVYLALTSKPEGEQP
jgi:ABC-2 type transport system ATP-binding protein